MDALIRVPRTIVAAVAVLALLASSLAGAIVTGIGIAPVAASGAPDLSLVKDGPGTILAGEDAAFTLTAAVPSGAATPAYNVSFRDVLPKGVAYKAGSTEPAGLGDPTIVTNPTTGVTTLVWSNLFDINPGGTGSITYAVRPDATLHPVGDSFVNTAGVYANSDPRVVPKFSATGAATGGYTGSAAASATTHITAIEIVKDETSVEHELMRGVHDDTTVYSLTVRNTAVEKTTGVTVTDYLPATLEFLACGGTDNSPAGMTEYPGAPRLTVVPAAGADCVEPDSVDTVSTTPPGGAPGIYTKVVWSFAELAAGSERTISYRAGIPLQANTLAWDGNEPSASSGRQGANLGNNNGATTAETYPTESSATNVVRAAGQYQGVDNNGDSPVAVSDEDRLTVQIEDLALHKAVVPETTTFSIGETAHYALEVRTSEYRSADAIVVTDVLPDGLTFDPASVTYAPEPSVPPTVTTSGTGPTTITFTFDPGTVLAATGAGGTVPAMTIAFDASMNATYSDGSPTAAGDEYENTTSMTGTTTPIAAVTQKVPDKEPGAQQDGDESAVSITSGGSQISKRIGQDSASADCATQTYDTQVPEGQAYAVGDVVCFELTVDFNPDNNTVSPVVTDFLPDELEYVDASWTTAGTGNTVPDDQIAFAANGTGDVLTWTLGADQPGGHKAVTPGSVFRVRFAALVVSAKLSNQPDVTGNLMKLISTDSTGAAIARRDRLEFDLAGSQVGISKGVYQVNGQPVAGNPPNTDHKAVTGGSSVVFRVDVTNLAVLGSSAPVRNVSIIDTLPSGLTCAAVSDISDGGSCSSDQVTWSTGSTPIEAGAGVGPFLFTVAIPDSVSVNTTYTNKAAVASYQSQVNTGQWTTNTPSVSDTSDVYTANVGLTKTGTTSITADNNNTANQATVGETITYTLVASVPAGTTASNGVISDTLPSGLQYVADSATVEYSATGSAGPWSPSLPAGTGQPSYDSGTRTLSVALPASFANDSVSADRSFRVTLSAKVLGGSYTNGQQLTNTAAFAGTGFTSGRKSYNVRVVLPNPQLAKSNDHPASDGSVAAGASVVYTLTVTNPQVGATSATNPARPESFDTVVVDCLPAGVVFDAYGTPPTGVTTSDSAPGNGTNGCAAGTTRLGWNVGTVKTTDTVHVSYTAHVASGQSGSVTFTNSATVTGSSIDDGGHDPAVEGVYSSTATSNIRTDDGTLTKTVSPLKAPVGATTTWTVTASIPAGLAYFGAAVVDTVPSGLSGVETSSVTCAQAGGACDGIPASPTDDPPGDFGVPLTPSGAKIGWLLGDLEAVDAVRTVTITYTATVADVPANVAGTVVSNSATLNSNTAAGDLPTSVDDTWESVSPAASANVTVVEPHVTIGKDVSDGEPAPGAPYTYSVTVANASGDLVSNAYDLTVTDVVPTGVVVDASSISDGGAISGADSTSGGGTITWHLGGPIIPGGSTVLTYTARLRSSLTSGAYTNVADVPTYHSTATGGRTYTDVDDAQATVVVGTASADLSIVKTPSGQTTAGSPWTFHLAVRNRGPSDAEGPVQVVDTLPLGLSFQSAGSGWSCAPVAQVVTCTLLPATDPVAGLAAGASAPDLVITVLTAGSPTSASYRNVATVSSETADPDPSNNTGEATVTVTPAPIPPDPTPTPTPTPTPSPTPTPTPSPTPAPPVRPAGPDSPGGSTPGGSGPKPQRPVAPLVVRPTANPQAGVVVLRPDAVTNAGQPIHVRVDCRPLHDSRSRVALSLGGSWVPLGDVTYCHAKVGKKGKVTVTVTAPIPVLVKLTYTAHAAPGYRPYKKVVVYVVRP